MNEENKIVIYQTEDGQTQIDVRLENDTVWLTQKQIAELFGTKRPAITKHLKNIYTSEELDENSTCSILEHMGNDGKQAYSTKYYNLDVILSVGYRVNSKNATRFRQWSNKVLKQYLIKGYAVNERIRKEQIGELRQLIGMVGRAIQNKQIEPDEENQALFDIVVAKSRGGTSELDNLLPACRACNLLKGDDSLDSFRLRFFWDTLHPADLVTYDSMVKAISKKRFYFETR